MGGRGLEPRTLSTAIFSGNGYSNVNGSDSKLSAAIADKAGQQSLDCANTRRSTGNFFAE